MNGPITFDLAIDMTPGGDLPSLTAQFNNQVYTPVTTPALYGSDWEFDSTMQIAVCSNEQGSFGVECIAKNLKITTCEGSFFITF